MEIYISSYFLANPCIFMIFRISQYLASGSRVMSMYTSDASLEMEWFSCFFLRSYRLCTQHCPAILPGKCSYRGKLALVGQSGNLDLLPIDDGRIIFVTMWTNDDGEDRNALVGSWTPNTPWQSTTTRRVGLLALVQIWTSLEKHTTTIMNQKKAIYIHLYTGRTTF